MVLRLIIRICRIQWFGSLSLFQTGNTLSSKFRPENQNCQFKLKFGTYTNSNMQNSMALLTFSVLDQQNSFWANLVKNQNCQFKLKFGTYTNSNMQNSMALLTFSVLDQQNSFWANLVQKIKIVSLSWNSVLRQL